jgi:hypothetical protein
MQRTNNFSTILFLYIIIFMFHNKISIIPGSDDSWFADISNSASLLEFIHSRYTTWSGRLFPDTMLYVLLDEYLWIWRIIDPLVFLLLAYYLVKLFKQRVTRSDLFLGVVSIGYISTNVLNTGMLWITGSINYLWPISMGLLAMYPFANSIFRYNTVLSNGRYLIFLISALLASISNEQVALCMSAFSTITLFSLYFSRKPFDKRLYILTFVIIVGTCILIFAPGNKLRWISEVNSWYPGYDELSFKTKIYLGVIWLFNQLFFELRNLVILLSTIVFIIYYRDHENKRVSFYVFSALLFTSFAAIFLGKIGFYNFDSIKQFQLSENILHFWNIKLDFLLAIFPFVFWTVYSCLLLYLILVKSKHKYTMFFLLAAAISTFVIMFFSPTIYASGPRTLTVGSVLLLLAIMKLIIDFDLSQNRINIIILSCLPLLNFVFIYFNMAE